MKAAMRVAAAVMTVFAIAVLTACTHRDDKEILGALSCDAREVPLGELQAQPEGYQWNLIRVRGRIVPGEQLVEADAAARGHGYESVVHLFARAPDLSRVIRECSACDVTIVGVVLPSAPAAGTISVLSIERQGGAEECVRKGRGP